MMRSNGSRVQLCSTADSITAGNEQVAYSQAELRREALDDGVGPDSHPPDLLKVLQFQDDRRRNSQLFGVDELARTGTQQIGATGIEPGGDVCVQIDQGFHSFDQST